MVTEGGVFARWGEREKHQWGGPIKREREKWDEKKRVQKGEGGEYYF